MLGDAISFVCKIRKVSKDEVASTLELGIHLLVPRTKVRHKGKLSLPGGVLLTIREFQISYNDGGFWILVLVDVFARLQRTLA